VSQENVEDYRRSADAWTRGDRDEWLSTVTPEWEFRASGIFPGVAGVYRGATGARDLWNDMRGPWEDFSIQVERTEDLGDTVVALITFAVTGRDGIETSRRWAHVVTYRDGRQTVTDNYESWEAALEAVGLEA
jgi:ketosteroid isomerase-like protein